MITEDKMLHRSLGVTIASIMLKRKKFSYTDHNRINPIINLDSIHLYAYLFTICIIILIVVSCQIIIEVICLHPNNALKKKMKLTYLNDYESLENST